MGDSVKILRAQALTRRRGREARQKSGGDPVEAARLLWAWSRQDVSFRNALVRVACRRLARAGRRRRGGARDG